MNKKGVLLLVLASIAYSGFLIFNRLALSGGFHPLQFSLMTVTLLSVYALPFLIKERKTIKKMSKKEWLYVVVIGVIASGIVQFMFVYGQNFTNATNAGFISTLSAPFTALFAVFMIKERLSVKKWIFGALGFLGIVIMSSNLKFASLNKGDLLIILAMFVVSYTNVLAKMAMKNLSGLLVNALRIVFGFSFVFLVLLFMGRLYQVARIPSIVWLYLVLSTILTFCFLAFFYMGIQLTSPTVATVICLSIVVFTSIFAIIFLKESLSPIQWLGGFIGAAAIALFAVSK